jgi:hypothetical protein
MGSYPEAYDMLARLETPHLERIREGVKTSGYSPTPYFTPTAPAVSGPGGPPAVPSEDPMPRTASKDTIRDGEATWNGLMSP